MICLRISGPYCNYNPLLRLPFLSFVPFPFARDLAQCSFSRINSSVITIIENLLVSMRGIHDCFDGIEINIASKVRSLEYLDAQILLHFAHDLYSVVELEMCVPIQMQIYAPIRIDSSRLAAQRYDFAEDADGLIGEGFKVFGVNAGGGFRSHRRGFARETDREKSDLVSPGC